MRVYHGGGWLIGVAIGTAFLEGVKANSNLGDTCPSNESETCGNTQSAPINCSELTQDPQVNSIQQIAYFEQPSCLLDAINQAGIPQSAVFSQCTYQLGQQAFATAPNGGMELAYPDINPTASMASTVAIFLVYFLLPLSYFFLVVIFRKHLYTKFSSLTGLQKHESEGQSELEMGETTTEDEHTMPVFVSFHRLSYTVKLNKGGIKKVIEANGGQKPTTPGWDQKRILKNITGGFRPRTLSAIMGPSGCGKSTLLDVLADRKQGGRTTGKVLINGFPRSKLFKRVSGYVMQFDALFPHLTVREVLMYTAELRIPGNDWRAKRKAVSKTIKDLDLSRCADSRIGGNGIPGISGGQARRVTVGIELITRPLILFLDEPTTGLDAFSSLQLVRTLRVLADTGRTVIATIHQPRPQIFDLFNTLLLMKDGRVAYFGAVSNIKPYFESIGVSVSGASVADAVVDLTYSKEKKGSGDASSVDMVAALADAFAGSVQAKKIHLFADAIESRSFSKLPPSVDSLFGQVDPATGETLEKKNSARFSQSLNMQIFILIRRSYKNMSRDSTYFTNVGLQMAQFLFYGLLFLGLRTENVTSESAGAVLGASSINYLFILQQRAFLFQVMNTIMLIEVVVIAMAFVEKTIFRREHASGAYSVVAYHVQFIIRFYVDAIWKGLIAAVLCYFFPPMRLSADAFFYFAAMLMVCSTMGSALAFLMVSLVPDAEGAANIHAQILGTFGLYSGFFLFSNVLPVWMKWLYYMLPFKYSFEGLELNEFTCMTVGEANYLFAIDTTLNRWTNLLVFMFYPPIFHAVAMLGSFAYTRPKSFWVKHCSCCFADEEKSMIVRSGSSEKDDAGAARAAAAAESSAVLQVKVEEDSASLHEADTKPVRDDGIELQTTASDPNKDSSADSSAVPVSMAIDIQSETSIPTKDNADSSESSDGATLRPPAVSDATIHEEEEAEAEAPQAKID